MFLTRRCQRRWYNRRAVGTFFHPITLTGPTGESETLEALVDTGADFSTMPSSLLQRLGVTPHRSVRMRLADGRVTEWELGRIKARIDGIEEETICVFGPEEAPPSIGAYTLEGMLLGVDPAKRRLVPREGFLLTTAADASFGLVADFELTGDQLEES